MSSTLLQDNAPQGPTQGRPQMVPTRQTRPQSHCSVSKRVCFYKSGDYKFSGHRMIISVRTFKTFDALVDTLSKKVPLPFGVRTITTPRGTHLVKDLDDLHDGGSYVCSDQRRVKPFNLSKLNWRQIPWNTTRPLSARAQKRLQFGQIIRRGELNKVPTMVTDRVTVRTPKRLVVIKNRDHTVRHTVVLHRKTAPTFEALLDHLSQILRFPVLKLYSTDGRRVNGLAALILCSGVVVAAGGEPFKPGTFNVHRKSQVKKAMFVENFKKQTRVQNQKSTSIERGSRKFSLSSEHYIVNQMNKSRNGSVEGRLQGYVGRSFETEVDQWNQSVKTCETGSSGDKPCDCILPHDDDIEKTFCVNQDGSMTVEMKVHLTIKEEEMLHWTTTLSRASLTTKPNNKSLSELVNCVVSENDSNIKSGDCDEGNGSSRIGKNVCFCEEQEEVNKTFGNKKSRKKRPSTPGLRRIKKNPSVESVNRTPEDGTSEGHCAVRCSSSMSLLKTEKMEPAQTNESFLSGQKDHLQMEDNGKRVSENESLKKSQKIKRKVKAARNNDSSKMNAGFSADKPSSVNKRTSGSSVNTKGARESQVENKKSENPLSKKSTVFNGYNVNTPTARPQMKKSISDILKPRKTPLLGKKTVSKPKSNVENLTDKREPSTQVTTQIDRIISNSSINPTPSEIHQYVENWLEGISQDQETCAEGNKEEFQSKVVFELGGDSESEDGSRNGNLDSQQDLVFGPRNVPENQPETHLWSNEQKTEQSRESCVSMTSVRRHHEDPEEHLKECNSAEVMDASDVSSSSKATVLTPQANIKSVLRQICSSMCMKRTSEINASNLERSKCLPDFPAHVALVFGSSCRAFLTFLTVMTLKDCLTETDDQSGKSSEAMQRMKHLMRISNIEDEEEQKTHLQSRMSDLSFEEHWKSFQALKEQTLSNNMSGGAVDLGAAGGAQFDFEELMDELNVPPEVRAQMSLTILQAVGFKKIEDGTFVPSLDHQVDPKTHTMHSKLEKMISQADADVVLHITQNNSKGIENKEQVEAVEEQNESREETGETRRTSDEDGQPGIEEEDEGEIWNDPEAGEVGDQDVGMKEMEEKSKNKLVEETDVNEEEQEIDGEEDEEQSREEFCDETKEGERAGREDVDDVTEGENEEDEEEEEGEFDAESQNGREEFMKTDSVSDQNVSEKEENDAGNLRMATSEEEEVEENEKEESRSENNVGGTESETEKENGEIVENSLNEEFKQESNNEAQELGVNGNEDNIDDALYTQQNHDINEIYNKHLVSTRCSTEGQCEKTLERWQDKEDRSINMSHPAGISQELLDFVNSALQSSSLTLTYDTQGNLQLVPENAQVIEENSYGLKRLPSFTTSDLSDYRPDSSESGGYKSQDSVDIITESERSPSVMTSSDDRHEDGGRSSERANESFQGAEEDLRSSSSKQSGRLYSPESDTEDVSDFGAESSLKTGSGATSEGSRCISSTLEDNTTDGVLIDRGRWLLKENHLMRRSPPDSNGMYDDVDSSSSQEAMSEDSLPPQSNQRNALVAISSSELEEMAKPQTPKCNFFNMSHGSDSDPFLEETTVYSSSVRGRVLRVSPTDPEAAPHKSNSMASFASVEFKMPDGKVHPEGGSSVVRQPRRTSSGGRLSLQVHDSTDNLRVRCGQFCPII